MKSKKILVSLIPLMIVIWCIKDFFLNDSSKAKAEAQQENFNFQSAVSMGKLLMEKDQRISILNSQIARFMKNDCKISDSVPTIYAITPTYARPVQKAELTRLSHTLMLVPNLHWIIIEDSEVKTELVANLLFKSGITYTHLNAATPKTYKHTAKEPRWVKPRGVLQRNTAIDWIRSNLDSSKEGIVYFLDDDNTYSLEVFEEMRTVKGVGVWPVGLVGGLMVERPKVDSEGKVIGWLTLWGPNRPFAIDMAGFAINLKLFFSKTGKFAFESERGYQESELLKHFVTMEELEVKADNCTKVYVWHTRTELPGLKEELKLKKMGKKPSDVGIEV